MSEPEPEPKPDDSGSSDDSAPSDSNSMDGTDGSNVRIGSRTPEAEDTVTITPIPDEGFEVDEITATDRNGDEVEAIDNSDSTYPFVRHRGRVPSPPRKHYRGQSAVILIRFCGRYQGRCVDAVFWAAGRIDS